MLNPNFETNRRVHVVIFFSKIEFLRLNFDFAFFHIFRPGTPKSFIGDQFDPKRVPNTKFEANRRVRKMGDFFTLKF